MGAKSVFLSYAKEEAYRSDVEDVAAKLEARGYRVFFDENSLPAGQSFDEKIRNAVEQCDLFVFFITPESVANGRYTRTELGFAQRRWPNPSGRVLPVHHSATSLKSVPNYLRANVQIFKAKGSLPVEVANFVEEVVPLEPHKGTDERPPWLLVVKIAAAVLALVLLIVFIKGLVPNEGPGGDSEADEGTGAGSVESETWTDGSLIRVPASPSLRPPGVYLRQDGTQGDHLMSHTVDIVGELGAADPDPERFGSNTCLVDDVPKTRPLDMRDIGRCSQP